MTIGQLKRIIEGMPNNAEVLIDDEIVLTIERQDNAVILCSKMTMYSHNTTILTESQILKIDKQGENKDGK